MERIENPMTFIRTEDEFIDECFWCGNSDAMNDIDIVIPDKKSMDYIDAKQYLCNDCYEIYLNQK